MTAASTRINVDVRTEGGHIVVTVDAPDGLEAQGHRVAEAVRRLMAELIEEAES